MLVMRWLFLRNKLLKLLLSVAIVFAIILFRGRNVAPPAELFAGNNSGRADCNDLEVSLFFSRTLVLIISRNNSMGLVLHKVDAATRVKVHRRKLCAKAPFWFCYVRVLCCLFF